MARAKIDPEVLAHVEWISFVRPTGLVVSAAALVRAGAILDRRDIEGQRILRDLVVDRVMPGSRDAKPVIPDFGQFASRFLGWGFSPSAYAGTPESLIPDELVAPSSEGGLRPDFAVRELEPRDGAPAWQLLVSALPSGADFDSTGGGAGVLDLSPHGRMERLLRQTRVSAGLLFNGTTLRLIAAPHRESSGWINFEVAQMVQTAGRPIATALRLLLNEPRLLALPRQERFSALLDDSRRFQNEVSERLAEQVLHGLYELLRGFQAADDAAKGELLAEQLREHPDEIYRGLLSVILRLVFLLYAEERSMLPGGDTWLRYYSLAGLYERLREDAALYPDTMDGRFGAWAQLLVLFRMVHDGASAGDMRLPQRHGALFDPDRYKFLEGRGLDVVRQIHEGIEVPLVPDGTVYRALEQLLVLDGERISYRALDVEQIGSVYETMMGFRLERATGHSVAIRAQKRQGAPTSVSLDALLALESAKRDKWLLEQTGRKLTDTVKRAVAAGVTVEDLHAALLGVIDLAASPDVVRKGAMVLQPSEERRRSGSHYTPRALTEPIVRTTLEPVLAKLRDEAQSEPSIADAPPGTPALGKAPRPEQILDLKVCDPAMGSGAFLVEACRQLGAALVESWHVHDAVPEIPADEREDLYAMRLVAQRCLYGVDRNPVAVDLAKMSLWLVTLAKEHPLTFLDHALRHGDSLVGLSRKQIEAFHWDATKPPYLHGLGIRDSLDAVVELRRKIREAGEDVPDWELRDLWDRAQFELRNVRLVGDLVVSAFFDAESAKEREAKRQEYLRAVINGESEAKRGWIEERRTEDPPLAPFHWEIEFPELYDGAKSGFDAIVGNPPFLGGTQISATAGMTYFQWLVSSYAPCEHHCDLVAYFFRRAFGLLQRGGCLGLIATNTIAQGDTREGGLREIVRESGYIYSAARRQKWPGRAAVIVSVVHISNGPTRGSPMLEGIAVSRINAYLLAGENDATPVRLASNPYFSLGSKIYGQGFLFADHDPECTPLIDRNRILEDHPAWLTRVPPYVGGEDINSSPQQASERFAISLNDVATEDELDQWPELRTILERKVKPERMGLGNNPNNIPLKRRWWAYQAHRPELYRALDGLSRVLAIARVSNSFAFTFLPAGIIYNEKVVVFPFESSGLFCLLQARVHETWARFFNSSLKDDMQYAPSDCFENFPLPVNWEQHLVLEAAGKAYYEFRADLMVRNNEGLTKTYNRFHDPNERDPDIQQLRDLHAAMDRAVLDVYGWTDIPTHCEFLLDYEIDEEEWGTKKKPYRFRWPDDIRDEVLARLLELNATRAKEEARAGASGAGKPTKKGGRKGKPESASNLGFDL